jgi:hypothetical protein
MRPGSIEYDPVLADEILERLADGDSLASICGEQGMPDERSVRRWARNYWWLPADQRRSPNASR